MITGDGRDSSLCMCDVVCVTEVSHHPLRSAAFSMPLDDLGLRTSVATTTKKFVYYESINRELRQNLHMSVGVMKD